MIGDDRSAVERVLAAPNPFADSALRNGFELPADVPEIHGEIRGQLRRLIDELRADARPRMIVVTGDPGDGKTHLLACLRAESETQWLVQERAVALVPVEPLRNVDAPFGHLLRALVAGLSRPLSMVPPGLEAPGTPMELLLGRILWRAARTLADHRDPAVAEAARELCRDDLTRRPGLLRALLVHHWPVLEDAALHDVPHHPAFSPPGVDGEIWSVICRFPREELSGLVCRWLGGQSLAEEDLRRIPVREPIEGEDRSLRALRTLLNLSDVPLVLGLDQLEGVRRLGPDAVPALFDALTSLYSEGGRLLVMLFCQTQVWAELAAGIEQHARDRVEQHLILKSLAPDLGERLIARRLSTLWTGAGETPPHPTAPYPAGFVRRTIEREQLRHPRQLLSYFARVGLTSSPPEAIAAPPPIDTRERARREYGQLLDKLRREPLPPPDERASLAEAALADLLARCAGRELAGVHVVAMDRVAVRKRAKPGVRARLARGGRAVTVYLEASNEDNGRAAAATADRLTEALRGVADRVLLLREDRMPLPRAAAMRMAQIAERSGVVQIPAGEEIRLAAIEKLLNAAASRDVEVDEITAGTFATDELAPGLETVRRFLVAALGAGAMAATAGAPGGAAAPEPTLELERRPS